MKAKTCQYCCNAKEASAGNRTILICTDKQGCEGKYFVVGPEDDCGNFKAGQTAPPPQDDGAKLIPLTKGKFAIVDAEDYPWLNKYKWHCRRNRNKFYAYRNDNRKAISMHRQLIAAPKGRLVDHINGDSLNNRKANVRLCTHAQNAHNRQPKTNSRSRYKGLSWHKRNRKWHVSIIKSGRKTFVGCFANQIEAAVAYDRKAEVLFGEFAYLNFPQLVEFRKWVRKLVFGA